MKATLMTAGFLFLALGLYLDIWPPNQPQVGWVCEETYGDTGSNATRGILYACGTSRYDGYARGNDSLFPKAGDFDPVVSGGKTFAIVGLGFMAAAIAVGQNQERSGRAAAPPGRGPHTAAGAPPMPGYQGPPGPPGPAPHFDRG